MLEFVDPLANVGRVIVNWRGQPAQEGTYIGYLEEQPHRCNVEIEGRYVWVDRTIITVPE